jgi:hypothetical protein
MVVLPQTLAKFAGYSSAIAGRRNFRPGVSYSRVGCFYGSTEHASGCSGNNLHNTEAGETELTLSDVQSAKLTTITAGQHEAGEHRFTFRRSMLPASIAFGAYFLVLTTPSGIVQKRVEVVR